MVVSPLGEIFRPVSPPAYHWLSRMRVLPLCLPVISEQRDGELMPLPA